MDNDSLSPASLAAVPEVQLWLAKYVAAATRYNDAQDFGASPETWPSLEQAEKEAESALLLAVRDATLKAERERVCALTPDEVVEEAVRCAVRKAQGIAANAPYGGIEPFYAELVPAIVPLLLAPEIAKREAAEQEVLGWSARATAAEGERDRLKEALGPDASGRDFPDLLDQCAEVLAAMGGGPMEDCLRLKATTIRAALGGTNG